MGTDAKEKRVSGSEAAPEGYAANETDVRALRRKASLFERNKAKWAERAPVSRQRLGAGEAIMQPVKENGLGFPNEQRAKNQEQRAKTD